MTTRYLERGLRDSSRPAIRDARGTWSYAELAEHAGRAAARMGPLDGRRVGFVPRRDRESVAILLGIFRAGGIAVPFSPRAAPRETAHAIADAGVSRIVGDPALAETGDSTVFDRDALLHPGPVDLPPEPPADSPSLILYTSGTTGRPKGVVHTHSSLAAQVNVLHRAWEWSVEDRLLHVLPLHHIHGLVNGVLGALYAGAELRFLESFEPSRVWASFAAREASVLYAVPTIYHQLAESWEVQDASVKRRWSEAAAELRLMVSGSAALPSRLWTRWRDLTGQALLERYGMTEIGMAISNPYRGERRPGTVGQPLPGMEVRIAGEDGEIWVRGPSLFREYWGRPDATRDSFRDGFFRTGDVAEAVDGYVTIRGRASVDILKSAGYKISALEIESVLLEHAAVREAAVVGLPDPEWGEVVTACLVLKESLTLDQLRLWCRDKLAPYKTPRRLHVCDTLPRNAMGKVSKPELVRQLGG